MDQTTRMYYNSTDKPINVLGVDIVKPHEHVSVTTKYQPTVILDNYPGLLDVTESGPPQDEVSSSKASPSVSPVSDPQNKQPQKETSNEQRI